MTCGSSMTGGSLSPEDRSEDMRNENELGAQRVNVAVETVCGGARVFKPGF